MVQAQYSDVENTEEIGNKAAQAYIKFRDEVLGLTKVTEYELNIDSLDEMALVPLVFLVSM